MSKITLLVLLGSSLLFGQDLLKTCEEKLGPCTLESKTIVPVSKDSKVLRVIYRCRDNVALDFSEDIIFGKTTAKRYGIYGSKNDLNLAKAKKLLQDYVSKAKSRDHSFTIFDWSDEDSVTLQLEVK
jgi:hypothetical protein